MKKLHKKDGILKSNITRIIELYYSLRILKDCTEFVNAGKGYHIISIFGQLRAILTDTTQVKEEDVTKKTDDKKIAPLLFDLEEQIGVELKIYYIPIYELLSPNSNWQDLVFSFNMPQFSDYRQTNEQKEIRLDEFLDKTILVWKEESINFREIINNISQKLGGAHYDRRLPIEIIELSNIRMGNVPFYNVFILQLVDVVVRCGIKLLKKVSDVEIEFGFQISDFSSEKIYLLDISDPRNFFRISIIGDNSSYIFELTDLVGNTSKIYIDKNINTNCLNAISISNCINDNYTSTINVFINGQLIENQESQPLLLSNEISNCNILFNKSIEDQANNSDLAVFYLHYFNLVLPMEDRLYRYSLLKKLEYKNSLILHNSFGKYNFSTNEIDIYSV